MEFFQEDKVLKVVLEGELDEASVAPLRESLHEYIDHQGVTRVFFNFKRVTFIDSSGLGLILGVYKKLAPHGGMVKIKKVSPKLERIFQLAGLDRIIEVSVEDQA